MPRAGSYSVSWDANSSRSVTVAEYHPFHYKAVLRLEDWRWTEKVFWSIKKKEKADQNKGVVLAEFSDLCDLSQEAE